MEQIELNFRDELKTLLTKYNAIMKPKDYCEDLRIEVYLPSVYENGKLIREPVTIDLGDCLDCRQ